jgi:hypothetical protein
LLAALDGFLIFNAAFVISFWMYPLSIARSVPHLVDPFRYSTAPRSIDP